MRPASGVSSESAGPGRDLIEGMVCLSMEIRIIWTLVLLRIVPVSANDRFGPQRLFPDDSTTLPRSAGWPLDVQRCSSKRVRDGKEDIQADF